MHVAAERSLLTLRKDANLSARDRCTPQASNMNNYDTAEGDSGREVEDDDWDSMEPGMRCRSVNRSGRFITSLATGQWPLGWFPDFLTWPWRYGAPRTG